MFSGSGPTGTDAAAEDQLCQSLTTTEICLFKFGIDGLVLLSTLQHLLCKNLRHCFIDVPNVPTSNVSANALIRDPVSNSWASLSRSAVSFLSSYPALVAHVSNHPFDGADTRSRFDASLVRSGAVL
eukprot:3598153-Amphidinium_carterae.1